MRIDTVASKTSAVPEIVTGLEIRALMDGPPTTIGGSCEARSVRESGPPSWSLMITRFTVGNWDSVYTTCASESGSDSAGELSVTRAIPFAIVSEVNVVPAPIRDDTPAASSAADGPASTALMAARPIAGILGTTRVDSNSLPPRTNQ